MTKFRKWRYEQKMSQQSVADQIGCHSETIKNWERGRKISQQYRDRFIAIYGFDPAEKFDMEVDERILRT